MEWNLLLLLVLVVLPAKMSILISPKSETKMHQTRPVRAVKICGDDYKKVVVFACGASRWKRSFPLKENSSPVRGSANIAGLFHHDSDDGQKKASALDSDISKPHVEPTSGSFVDLYNHYKNHAATAEDGAKQHSTDLTRTANKDYPYQKQTDPDDLRTVCCVSGCTYEDIVRKHCS